MRAGMDIEKVQDNWGRGGRSTSGGWSGKATLRR